MLDRNNLGHSCWLVALTLADCLPFPPLCVCVLCVCACTHVCVTYDSRHHIRWWVPGNPNHLQAESRDIRVHGCQRHRCWHPDRRHHRQLWVHRNLKVPKVELLPKKSSSGTELPLSTSGNHLRGSLVGYCLLLPLFWTHMLLFAGRCSDGVRGQRRWCDSGSERSAGVWGRCGAWGRFWVV